MMEQIGSALAVPSAANTQIFLKNNTATFVMCSNGLARMFGSKFEDKIIRTMN